MCTTYSILQHCRVSGRCQAVLVISWGCRRRCQSRGVSVSVGGVVVSVSRLRWVNSLAISWSKQKQKLVITFADNKQNESHTFEPCLCARHV